MEKIETILKCLIDNLEEGIQIVDSEGRTVYYNNAMAKVEGLKSEEVIGKKVIEYLNGVEEDSSTLMNVLKHGEKLVDVIQHYSSHDGKKVTTINTTIPIKHEGKTIAAVEISKDMTQLKELNEKLCKLQASNNKSQTNYNFNDIIGKNAILQSAINKAAKASLSNSSVLIYGETGSGKEVFAQSIHYNSLRKDKPFMPINCAAIPSALLEGMLFGTIKGSYTGAENRKGLFEEANGGTILLDEINSMEPVLQSKLLRVLQEGYIRPVGSNKTIDVDIRIIATLNEKPEKLIEEGRLRKDFYYRLGVIRIDIPPLRQRKDDIPLLVKYFIEHYNKVLCKNIIGIDEEAMIQFKEYDWPGNIRELKNVIESAMNLSENSGILTKECFDNRAEINSPLGDYSTNYNNYSSKLSLEEYLDKIEMQIIKDSLKKNNKNITKTAEELKMTRQNLQYKIKKYKLP